MKLWLILGAAALVIGLVMAYAITADARAKEAGERAERFARVNEGLLEAARADSVALDRIRTAFEADSTYLAQEREQASLNALQAAERASEASRGLRATLDSLGASTAALELLEQAHAEEVSALKDQLAAADSATQIERTLREATEAALRSERSLRQGVELEREALRDQVSALNSRARRQRLLGGGVGLVLLGVALLR